VKLRDELAVELRLHCHACRIKLAKPVYHSFTAVLRRQNPKKSWGLSVFFVNWERSEVVVSGTDHIAASYNDSQRGTMTKILSGDLILEVNGTDGSNVDHIRTALTNATTLELRLLVVRHLPCHWPKGIRSMREIESLDNYGRFIVTKKGDTIWMDHVFDTSAWESFLDGSRGHQTRHRSPSPMTKPVFTEFSRTFHRQGSGSLGLRFVIEHSTLVVVGVAPYSILAKWNTSHPDEVVMPGDTIADVNGYGDIEQMQAELVAAPVVTILFHRENRQTILCDEVTL